MNKAETIATTDDTKKPVPQIVEKAKLWIAISLFFLSIGVVSMIVSTIKYKAPVLLGIDFVGGTKIEYKFDKASDKLNSEYLRRTVLPRVSTDVASGAIAQVSENSYLMLRVKELPLAEREKLDKILSTEYGKFSVESVETVSATIGPELLTSGLLALVVTLLGISLYVSYRFRRDFAICTIIALIHDVSMAIGLFSLLGVVYHIEVNSLFLTACLTVLGFSVHDTIVVFDRIRENMKFLSKKNPLSNIINQSITQVWFRSLCTSMTALFALGSLFFLGGESTQIFAATMFVGVMAGAYSSLFIAPILLYYMNTNKNTKVAIKS